MSDYSVPDSNANILQRLEEILVDIKTLLDYLGRLDNSRLQAHFDDTRSAATETVALRAVPPCRTYAGFLARLAWLGTAIRKGHWPAEPMPQSSVILPAPSPAPADAGATQSRVDQPLDDIPFLVWSRDFLASVASPATVETIDVTRAYVEARARHRLWLWLKQPWTGRTASRYGGGNRPPQPNMRPAHRPDDEHTSRRLHGARLATLVGFVEIMALFATFLALVTSTYVLSGQTILNQKQTEASSYATLKQQIEAAVENLPQADRQGIVDPISICMQVMQPAETLIAALGPVVPPATTEAVDQKGPNIKLGYYCRQEHDTETQLDATATSLQAWVRVITRPHDVQFFAYSISLPGLAALFGDAPEPQPRGAVPPAAQQSDQTGMLERSGVIAQSILSAVSLYLMPCLYGLIGAAAATLRMLRRKVDAATLGYTDRGGLKQNLILGVMCGATIGLFSGYILGATPTQGLGLSALALLAGYNVSGVFAFLDELSARLFRPTDTVPGKG